MASEAKQQQQSTHSYRKQNTATIESLINGWATCTVQQAYDELVREMNVREKCFVSWIDCGKLSESDASDRVRRMAKACSIFAWILDDPGMLGVVESHCMPPVASDRSPAESVPTQAPATN